MFAPAHAPRRVTPALSAVAAVDAWQFFMGYRYGIFNYATTSLEAQSPSPAST